MGDDALMTDKAGDSEPSIPSWMGTVVVAIAVSVSAGLVDGGFTRWRMDIAIGETAWLAVVTATLSAFFALVLAFVGLAIGQTRPIRWLWQRVTERPLAQVGIALFSFVVALVLHWVNATYYVRLYLSIHLAISLVCFCLGILAFGLLLALPRARSNLANLTKRNPKRIVTIGGLVWLLLLAMTISGIRSTHRLRSIALDRSTTLSHQLIVLDSFTGILSREAPSAIDVPTALAKALAPEPLLAPRGLAPRSHVVLITVDSLRADRLTATGAQMATLPVLEALSTESVLFTPRARALLLDHFVDDRNVDQSSSLSVDLHSRLGSCGPKVCPPSKRRAGSKPDEQKGHSRSDRRHPPEHRRRTIGSRLPNSDRCPLCFLPSRSRSYPRL